MNIALIAHDAKKKLMQGGAKQSFRLTLFFWLFKIQAMKQSFLFFATFAAAACVASADDVHSITAALDAGLTKQLEILQSISFSLSVK